jgi:transcriptional regulator with XRE-family HTH domain
LSRERPRRVDGTITRLGEKLEALRTARGWKQEEVAAALGYAHHSSYTKLEKDTSPRPTAERVLMLARLYGVSADVLLKDEEDLPPEATTVS